VFAAALTACGPEAAEPSPQARAFVSQVKSALSGLTPLLVAPLVKQDVKAAEEILGQHLHKAARNGKPPPYQVGLLDSQGRFFASSDPLSAKQKMPQAAFSGIDYSNYQIVNKIRKSRRIVQGVLYLAEAKAFMVAGPVLKEGELVGILGLMFSYSYLTDKAGLSQEEFLALELDQ
jgi:hypothetical protein